MPFTAQELIEEQQRLVTVKLSDSLNVALEYMLRNDFSQLPVVATDSKPVGLLTLENILQGTKDYRVSLETLRVEHVCEKPHVLPLDHDIFDLLNVLKTCPAVLIADMEGCLVGIITPWDTSEYFRVRAQDIMLVEDVESSLRDHIRAAFWDKSTNDVDEGTLAAIINDTVNSNSKTFEKVKNGLKHYFNLVNIRHTPEDETVERAFSKLLERQQTKLSLDDLTLYQEIQILFHDSVWDRYSSNFGFDKQSVQDLLHSVRQTRNTLAHFREKISELQRRELRSVLRLIQTIHYPHFPESVVAPVRKEDNELVPLDEELAPTDSRYARLALFLQEQPTKKDKITLNFSQIEEIIGMELPPSSQRVYGKGYNGIKNGYDHAPKSLPNRCK
jgi:CBS domain-containing protein